MMLPSYDDSDDLPLEYDGPAEVEAPPPVVCWRCGKQFPLIAPACPFCHARNDLAPQQEESQTALHEQDQADRPLRITIWTFGILLVTGLIFGGIAHLTAEGKTEVTLGLATDLTAQMGVMEFFDTVLVIIALAMCGWLRIKEHVPFSQRAITWVLALPVLVISLGVNYVYHEAIRNFTGQPLMEDELLKYPELLNLLLVLICVQPAIVEELYFRQIFLPVLNRYMGVHGSVWISAAAFGLLHLGAPLSIPYLTLLGGVLGYLRVFSGGIWLPMLFHFAHNGAVVAGELFP